MRESNEPDGALVSRYEVAFCVLMAAAAYLWRDNLAFVYPDVLYLLALLLGLNLAAGLSLRLWPARSWLSAAFIGANCAVITALLRDSGGSESNLWVLYLLPIYTASLLLGGREVAWVAAGTVAFNAGLVAAEEAWSGGLAFELVVKSGILVLSAGLTRAVAERDRRARGRLAEQRGELERLQSLTESQSRRIAEDAPLAQAGLLSSGAAHDLGSTFTVILGFVEIARLRSGLSAEAADDLARIEKSARLGREIVLELMDAARSPKSERASCDAREALQSVLEVLVGPLQQAALGVRVCCEGPVRVPVPRTQLQRLFLNLINNAIKAVPAGGIVTVSMTARFGQARIVVEDDGPGLPAGVLAAGFKPFVTTRAAEGGTGLGLYNCARVAAAHGGTLSVENRAEGGARFIAVFPLAEKAPGVSVISAPARETASVA